MDRIERSRVWVTIAIFLFINGGIIAKSTYLQLINQKNLVEYSKGQFSKKNVSYPRRGQIFDRNGHPLAVGVRRYNIFTLPQYFSLSESKLKKIKKYAPSLNIDNLKKVLPHRKRFTWLARNISLVEGGELELKKMKGVFLEEIWGRYYPNGQLAGQVLGFVGVDNSGLAGIESKFNTLLRGEANITKYLLDAKGRPVKVLSPSEGRPAVDLQLSLDRGIQAASEKYLEQTVEKTQALAGGIGVLEVTTGEILAMAHYPPIDPNNVNAKDRPFVRPSFVTDPIEPGSILKIFTAASGLKRKVARSNSFYFCENGRLKVENHIISEASPHQKYGWLSLKEVMAKSSNIGVTKLAFDIGLPSLLQDFKQMGLGVKTGIELPGESRGIVPSAANRSKLTLSNISFGQGIAVTPIQVLAAYGAIANGGTLISPTILKKSQAQPGQRVMDAQIAKSLTDMLKSTVKSGTGQKAKMEHYQIAGKTGTAQKPSKEGGYENYVVSFVGFPTNVKKPMVILAYIDSPTKGPISGNSIAAPLFKKVAQYILFKQRGPRQNKGQQKKAPILANMAIRKAQRGSWSKKNKKIPNFLGLDKISAQKLAKEWGINIKNTGTGLVLSQYPAPGGAWEEGPEVELNFYPPQLADFEMGP